MDDTQTQPERLRTLKNGAVYDMQTKRIVASPGGGTTAITKETTGAMQARRQELKRERIIAGANAAVADGGKFDGRDLDFVEAIAEVQAIKALNPDDPKSTDAARFLLQEAGIAEARGQAAGTAVPYVPAIIDALGAFIEQVRAHDLRVGAADGTLVDQEQAQQQAE